MTKSITLGLMLMALAGPALAQEAGAPANPPPPQQPAAPSKASLAIMPFTFNVEVLQQQGDDIRLAIRTFETSAFTNKFITALVNTRKFDIVERSRVDELVNEMQMSESGLMDARRAARAGQMIGADYFLMGEISVFTINVLWRPIPSTTRFTRTITSQIIVDMRIVDTRTSRVVAADKGEVREEVRSMHDAQVATVFPPDMIDGLQRRLCEQLTLKTIDGVYPIRVIGFSNGTVSLNRGEGGGLQVGQTLDVFSEGEELLDPDTGESLGSEEVRVGQVRVTEVLARFSKAVPVGTNMTVPNGAICRRVEPAVEPQAPNAPPRGPRW
jgi:curli biogenesis system outer membrane secretion channel CsgG